MKFINIIYELKSKLLLNLFSTFISPILQGFINYVFVSIVSVEFIWHTKQIWRHLNLRKYIIWLRIFVLKKRININNHTKLLNL